VFIVFPAPWQQLSDRTIIHIFSYLTLPDYFNLLVCNQALNEKLFTYYTTLSFISNSKLRDDKLNTIAIKPLGVRCLYIDDCSGITDAAFNNFKQHVCAKLERFTCMKTPKIKSKVFTQFSARCLSLRYLNLSYNTSTTVNNDVLTQFSKHCKNLDTIILRECKGITGVGLNDLVTQNCTSLRHLDISGCSAVREDALQSLMLLKNIQILNLNQCYLKQVNRLGIICTQLRTLSVANMTQPCLDNAIVELLVPQRPYQPLLARSLVDLDLSGNTFLSDTVLQTIAQQCPKLHRLKIQGLTKVTNTGIEECIEKCQYLEELDVSNIVSSVDVKRLRLFAEQTCQRLNVKIISSGTATNSSIFD